MEITKHIEFQNNSNNLSSSRKFILLICIGFLSFIFAELFAGSTTLFWFMDLWSLILTFPLYLGHILFFFNQALKRRRTSYIHLYFWGCIYGMYESWITQVLWFGYESTGVIAGLNLFGIGVFEFLTLVFFWHPIFAFILPLFIFETFCLNHEFRMKKKFKREDEEISNIYSETASLPKSILPSHISVFQNWKSRKKLIYLISALSMIIGAINLVLKMENFSLYTAIPILFLTYLIPWGLFRLAMKKKKTPISLNILKLSPKLNKILLIYLVCLYIMAFLVFGVLRGLIRLDSIIMTILLYTLLILIVLKTKEDDMFEKDLKNIEIYPIKPFWVLFLIQCCIIIGIYYISRIVPSSITILGFICMFYASFMGLILFIVFMRKRKKKNRTAKPK